MVRTAVFAVSLGALFAWNWGRLEEPRTDAGSLWLMVALGAAPALLPSTRWRLAGAAAALLAAASIAFDVSRPYAIGELAGRAGGGFFDFYEVLVPFDGATHPFMHGDVLLAVFAFTALAGLAIAARRPLAAGLVLLAGVGWPATILPGTDDLARGAVVLAALLALVAWLKPEPRRASPQILVGTGIVIAALVASSSGAVAKRQFIAWQDWDLSTRTTKAVDVTFVWRSNYRGIEFPRVRTQVLTVEAPARSTYWRATTLDSFADHAWREDLVTFEPDVIRGEVHLDDLSRDPLLPPEARNSDKWTRADFRIEALRDIHVVGPSGPVAYDASQIGELQYHEGGVAYALRPPRRGTEYSAWGYQPEPRPSKLAKSPAEYPEEIAFGGRYLTVAPGRAVPPFGTERRVAWLADAFSNPSLEPYRPLYRQAEEIAGRATNPYAAAVALEAWLRSGGGFFYDEKPGQVAGVPPLVAFVTRTKRGYCQHFAGAMALMLRYLGIPARVAAGFTSGTYDSDRDAWRVYDRNAHTWVEVWFKGHGWLPFDPTPGRGNLGGPYTSSSIAFDAPGAERILGLSALDAELLKAELEEARTEGRGAVGAPIGDVAKGRGGGGRSAGDTTAGVLLVVLLGLAVAFVAVKLGRRRRRYLTHDPRLIGTACRRELVEYLLDVGITLPQSSSFGQLREVVRKRTGVEIGGLVNSVGLARFGPPSAASIAAREAKAELRLVRRRLRRALPFGRRARGLFSIRSLLPSS